MVVVGCTVQPYHITVQCGDNTLQQEGTGIDDMSTFALKYKTNILSIIMRRLLQSIRNNNIDDVILILASLPHIINETDSGNTSPLLSAAKLGNVDLVELLLRNGASLGLVDKKGRTKTNRFKT